MTLPYESLLPTRNPRIPSARFAASHYRPIFSFRVPLVGAFAQHIAPIRVGPTSFMVLRPPGNVTAPALWLSVVVYPHGPLGYAGTREGRMAT